MEPRARSPWTYIPLLYFLQAVPVSLIQDVAAIAYKDLGIPVSEITRWTSLIALPWGLQMLLGPFVNLSFTKRGWILGGQAIIAVGLVFAAFLLQTPNAFGFSLVVLGLTAVMSALCNIATDGFAILSMTKTQQAQFAGIMFTFFRLGRLFCASLLVYIAGLLMRKQGLSPGQAWFYMVLLGALVYFGFHVAARIALPKVRNGGENHPPPSLAALDDEVALTGEAPSPSAPSAPLRDPARESLSQNLLRTIYLLMIGVGGYFALNAVVRLVAHGIWFGGSGSLGGWDIEGWKLPDNNSIPFLRWPAPEVVHPVAVEVAQFVVCAAIVAFAATQARRLMRGTEFGEALGSFVSQPGFAAILFFVVFYRFPEAMVGKISPLFLKDSIDKGGLALPNEQLGVLSGFLGVLGIICGGVLGGLFVSRVGLRKAFLPVALAMHVPNVLYLWASSGTMPMTVTDLPVLGPLNLSLGGIIFVDQFGYGFGFAAYMVYLMWVAQRGRFQTSHYAIATGMGALCIAVSGVLSGVVYDSFGYSGVFWFVILASIPGLLSLRLVPLE